MTADEIKKGDQQAEVLARYEEWVAANPEVQRRIAKAKAANGSPSEPITAEQLEEWLSEARAGRPVQPGRRN